MTLRATDRPVVSDPAQTRRLIEAARARGHVVKRCYSCDHVVSAPHDARPTVRDLLDEHYAAAGCCGCCRKTGAPFAAAFGSQQDGGES